MLARTGDVAQSNRLTGYVQTTQSRMREAQIQIATGKRAQRFSALGGETAILLHARETRQRTEAFLRTNTETADRLHMMSNALGNIEGIAERLRALLVQRLAPSVGDDLPLAAEVDSMLQEVAAQLNVRLGDRYLFAGSRTDTPPVALPATVDGPADLVDIYRGDQVRLATRAADDVTIEYGVLASDALDLLNVLATIKEAHLAGDLDTLRLAQDDLVAAFDSLTSLRGQLGARLARLESVTVTHGANAAYLDEMISRIEDTDLPAAVARLTQDQTVIEASYLTISRINSVSLADYLR